MNYLLDTNLLLLKLRQDTRWDALYTTYALDKSTNLISVVTVGELYSLALQNNWGTKRLEQIGIIRKEFVEMDIRYEPTIQRYAEIDAFSQGKLKNRPLSISARNMGKNDLWIAATASVFDLTLLTTDKDFDHLDKEFLSIAPIII